VFSKTHTSTDKIFIKVIKESLYVRDIDPYFERGNKRIRILLCKRKNVEQKYHTILLCAHALSLRTV